MYVSLSMLCFGGLKHRLDYQTLFRERNSRREQKNRADLKHGQDVVIDVNFNCSFKPPLLVHKENICSRYHSGKLTFAREAADIYVMLITHEVFTP